MTSVVAGDRLARRINAEHPDTAIEWNDTDVWIEPSNLLNVARLLYEASDLDFSVLTSVSAVDYIEYFELVYHVLSMRRNQSAVLKTRCFGRGDLSIDSVIDIWRGAELQEREIYDLMGIKFQGHPNMKRILLWEGFEGHPLRKDFLR